MASLDTLDLVCDTLWLHATKGGDHRSETAGRSWTFRRNDVVIMAVEAAAIRDLEVTQGETCIFKASKTSDDAWRLDGDRAFDGDL